MGFHSPLIRPAISWGVNVALGGVGPLDSHDFNRKKRRFWARYTCIAELFLPLFFALRVRGAGFFQEKMFVFQTEKKVVYLKFGSNSSRNNLW